MTRIVTQVMNTMTKIKSFVTPIPSVTKQSRSPNQVAAGQHLVKATVAASLVLTGTVVSTNSFAEDTKVALVPGGPHPYFAAWEQAGQDAGKDFGLVADYKVPTAWELNLQNELIESLVSGGYNAILVFPGDAVGTNSTLAELDDFGIPTAALAGCVDDPTTAKFCLGTDTGHSAYLGTKELISALGGKGKIAHFTGFLVDPNTKLRIAAVEKAVAEANGDVEIVQVLADIDAPQPADEKINALLAARADEIDGIITTAWVPAVVASTALRNIGDKRIVMVGIDHDQVVLDAISDGFVHGTMLQNPYGQGYIGSFAMHKIRGGCTVKDDAPWKETAQTKRFIDSGTAFVGLDKVANYVDAMKAETDRIMQSFEADYLDCSG